MLSFLSFLVRNSPYALFSVPALCLASLAVQLTPSVPSPQPLGTPITWTATVTGDALSNIDYQFSLIDSTGAAIVVQDYSETATMTRTPAVSEGIFGVRVIARDKAAATSAQAQASFTATSRVTGTAPIVNATAHPLVALYSAASCPVGSSIYVVFGIGQKLATNTNTRACDGVTSMNFYVGGMAPATTYWLHHVVVTGTQRTSGPQLSFTTGTIPTNLLFPEIQVPVRTGPTPGDAQSVLLMDHIGPNGEAGTVGSYFPAAYSPSGQTLWYYSGLASASQNHAFFIRPVPGGTFLLHANDPNSAWVHNQLWREIDLAGNTLRETNVTRVNEQIGAPGYLGCTSFSHDSIRLPNGHTLIICTQERIYPAGTQGSSTSVDIGGDGIVDLDQNLQLAWYWSGYDHLDVQRRATLGEILTGNTGFSPVVLANFANDWLHANSLNYVPSTGDVLLSMRDQDWVIRIQYANGTGDGSVVWRMGVDGDFAITGTDPYPWFTHQHDVEYEAGSSQYLSVYDNGNLRHVKNPGVVENSRGMFLAVDESNLVVTPISSIDLGGYSAAGGSAQLLDNGDLHFDSSLFGQSLMEQRSQSAEYGRSGGTSGTLTYALTAGDWDYRTYRMISLYRLD